MKCTNCNAELIEGAKFCGKCGTPAPKPEPEEIKCSKCGAKLVPNAKFCGKCGTPVQPTAPVAPAQPPVKNKKEKKNGNAGLIVAIIIMCLLLVAVIGAGVYFLVINPDAMNSWFGGNEEIETTMDDEDEEDEEKEDEDAEEVEEATDDEEDGEVEVVEEAEPEVLKDYENPEYMNGPLTLGRSDRVSVLEFVAPVPDDSIKQPEDGSIPVQYFDPSIHEYDLFIEDVTFYEASQRCEEMGGHLATVVCKEELDMIQNLLKQAGYDQREVPYIIWLGAYQDQATGMYAWCTDEGIGVSNWKPGEPSGADPDTGEKEEYIMMMYDVAADQWLWVDESYDISEQYAGNIAYLCEWEVITDPNYYEDLKTRE